MFHFGIRVYINKTYQNVNSNSSISTPHISRQCGLPTSQWSVPSPMWHSIRTAKISCSSQVVVVSGNSRCKAVSPEGYSTTTGTPMATPTLRAAGKWLNSWYHNQGLTTNSLHKSTQSPPGDESIEGFMSRWGWWQWQSQDIDPIVSPWYNNLSTRSYPSWSITYLHSIWKIHHGGFQKVICAWVNTTYPNCSHPVNDQIISPTVDC